MSDKSYNSPELDAVRKKIDALDHQIHDALMARAELVLQIGAEKRKRGIQVVQPAREAQMIRRLLARHKGALPQMAVVRIWRELVSAVSLLQTGLRVSVYDPINCGGIWDMARDYFGGCLPMKKAGAVLSALGAVRDDEANFAVVPYPALESDNPWWMYLNERSEGQDRMYIIVRLPHGDDSEGDPLSSEGKALVVSKSGFDSSGEDHSFLLIHCSGTLSRGKITDVAAQHHFKALGLFSSRCTKGEINTHLLEVDCYLGGADNQARIDLFAQSLGEGAQAICVGGYPVPPVYAKTIIHQEEEEKS